MTTVIDTQKAIGKLVENDNAIGQKDAIHIAVVVVEAGQHFTAGQWVSMYKGKAYGAFTGGEPVIGIVDPFLTLPVYAGNKFYLFLKPNTITNMRHEWTLPAFDDVQPTKTLITIGDLEASSSEVIGSHLYEPARQAAEWWLRDFAEEMYMDYDNMIRDAIAGNRLLAGTETYNLNTDEFWDKMEILTGKKFDQDHREGTYFSCSC